MWEGTAPTPPVVGAQIRADPLAWLPRPGVLVTVKVFSIWLPNKQSPGLIHVPAQFTAPRKDGQASLGYSETTDGQMQDRLLFVFFSFLFAFLKNN